MRVWRNSSHILTHCGVVVVKVLPVGQKGVEGILNGETMAGIRQTGSIRRGDGFGFIRFGHSAFGAVAHVGGVYQKRVTGYNNTGRKAYLPRKAYYVRMRYYRPTNPNTPEQQAKRTLFADAMASWQGLSPTKKTQWKLKASRHSRRGHNLYISEYMKYSGNIP